MCKFLRTLWEGVWPAQMGVLDNLLLEGILPSSILQQRRSGVVDQALLPQECELDSAMQLLLLFQLMHCKNATATSQVPSSIFG